MWYNGKILKISWVDKVTNEEVKKRRSLHATVKPRLSQHPSIATYLSRLSQ